MNSLDYAIEMELDGVRFYKELALIVEGEKLHEVCSSLARDEEIHAKILTDKKADKKVCLEERPALIAKNVFSGTDDFRIDKNYTAQLDVYKVALDKEQKSIELYQKMLSEMPEDRDIFEYLIRQEKEHYSLMEEIIKMVNRPNEWVEAAEFGIREEY